jgi:hypothetical protein
VSSMTKQSAMSVEPCNKEHFGNCKGEVTYWLRPSDWTSWPKCQHHLNEAVNESERIQRTYGSDTAPEWFDPSYAGEEW